MSVIAKRFLRALRDAGDDGVAKSVVPKSCGTLVANLLTCQAIRWHQSGRGGILRIINRQAFDAFAVRQFPLGIEEPVEPVVDRAAAVLLLGDAKAVDRASYEGVFVRSTNPGTIIRDLRNDKAIFVADLTEVSGGAAILLDDSHEWSFAGTVGVVENAEAFWRHDRVLDVDLAVYAAGRISSRRVLAWLASPAMERCTFIHWGDYDPVGAYEYHRLATACPSRVSMHIPDGLDELLAHYGKEALLIDQIKVLEQVRTLGGNPVIASLLNMWDRHHRGLEQELLLALS